MKVYYDIISGDEIISDSYKIEPVFNGGGAEVRGRLVVKGAAEVDIGNYHNLSFDS